MRLTVVYFFLLAISSCSTHSTAHSSILKHESVHLSELGMHLGEKVLQHNPGRKVLQASSQDVQLMDAVDSRDYAEVERLLNEGADPNYTLESGYSALHSAVAADSGRIVTLLLGRGANIDGPPGSNTEKAGPLQIAAYFDAPKSVDALLNAGAPIDRLNSEGFAPLHIAATRGSVRAAIALLDREAPIDQGSKTGAPPLLYAAFSGHLSMVRLLLSRGADVNSGSNYGNTPLHEAAQENLALIVQELLDSGADIDAQASNGETPLYQAAFLGNHAVIQVLVLNGANKSIKTLDETPREALCACLDFPSVLDLCSVDECEYQQRMLDLLT